MFVSLKFFTEFGFDQNLHGFCRNSEVVAVSIFFEKVLMMKVIIQQIVIKYELSEAGVAEDKDTKMNWSVEVNFLFSFLYFIIIIR